MLKNLWPVVINGDASRHLPACRLRPCCRSVALSFAVLALGLLLGLPSAMAESDTGFATCLEEFRAEAVQNGIREDILDAAWGGVAPIPRIIELDRRQPECTVTC